MFAGWGCVGRRGVLFELAVFDIFLARPQPSGPWRGSPMLGCPEFTPRSLTYDLDQNPLLAPAIELTVEDLLPRAKIELAASDNMKT
jgi:hypothetical protein